MKKKLPIYIISLFFISQINLSAREFLNTYVHLNFGGMYTSFLSGDMIDAEEKVNEDYFSDTASVSHYETAFCATLDIVPMKPIILGMESHAFKLGIRGSYRLHFLEQRITNEDNEYENRYITYKSWMIGPVIHYAPTLETSDINGDYTSAGGFTFYALYGKINGDLTSGQAITDSGGSVSDNDATLSGYKVDIGVGAELAICSLNFGVNFYYTYINMQLNNEVYSGLGKETVLKEVCMEIYLGIPIESFIEPLIPRF